MKRKQQTEMIVCENCGVKSARVVKCPQVLGRGTKMMLVDNVPVITCRNCGESYMTGKTIHSLDKMRLKQNFKVEKRKIDVAEFV